jgi:hypothetical protein
VDDVVRCDRHRSQLTCDCHAILLGDKEKNEMNKLTGLNKLANAYHTLKNSAPLSKQGAGPGDWAALGVLLNAFGYIRRSLRIEDLRTAPKSAEGLNPSGPRYL